MVTLMILMTLRISLPCKGQVLAEPCMAPVLVVPIENECVYVVRDKDCSKSSD
jgi:hypothetical protein